MMETPPFSRRSIFLTDLPWWKAANFYRRLCRGHLIGPAFAECLANYKRSPHKNMIPLGKKFLVILPWYLKWTGCQLMAYQYLWSHCRMYLILPLLNNIVDQCKMKMNGILHHWWIYSIRTLFLWVSVKNAFAYEIEHEKWLALK